MRSEAPLPSADPAVVSPLHLRIMRMVAEAAEAYEAPNLRLEGGTALAAYDLHHRQSEDLDFFADYGINAKAFGHAVETYSATHGLRMTAFGASSAGMARYVVLDPSAPDHAVKVDFAAQSPFRLDPLRETADGIRIGSFRDLCAGKLHAIGDRFEERDFIDLHVIVTRDGGDAEVVRSRFRDLLSDVMRIDPGLNPSYVGQGISRGLNRPIVTALSLRLLIDVGEDAIQRTLDLCIDECARATADAASDVV